MIVKLFPEYATGVLVYWYNTLNRVLIMDCIKSGGAQIQLRFLF